MSITRAQVDETRRKFCAGFIRTGVLDSAMIAELRAYATQAREQGYEIVDPPRGRPRNGDGAAMDIQAGLRTAVQPQGARRGSAYTGQHLNAVDRVAAEPVRHQRGDVVSGPRDAGAGDDGLRGRVAADGPRVGSKEWLQAICAKRRENTQRMNRALAAMAKSKRNSAQSEEKTT